jgi:hypothetical protein
MPPTTAVSVNTLAPLQAVRERRRQRYDRPMLSEPFTGDELNREVREL